MPNVVGNSGSGRETVTKKLTLKTTGGGNAGGSFSMGVLQQRADFTAFRGSAFPNGNTAGFLFSAHSPVTNPVWEGGRVLIATTSEALH